VDDKQVAVYATIANYPTLEEARTKALEISRSLLLSMRQVSGFITTAATKPTIREELAAAGFADKQLPPWMGAGSPKQAVPPTPPPPPPPPTPEHSGALGTTVKPLTPAGTPALKTAATKTNTGASGASGVVDSGRVV